MNEKPEAKDRTRTLVYVPIVHTEADLGLLGESIRQAGLSRKGKTVLRRKAAAIDKIWAEIQRAIDGLELVYERVRLYQDGLPVCGREGRIVEELAASGSRNHQLLSCMMAKGATLMGTESAQLLITEYDLCKGGLGASSPSGAAKMNTPRKALAESVLKARDRYIAERINHTLCAGETGVLFLGMLHSPERFLDRDIQLAYPMGRPAGAAGR